jgi:threonylcarbamoyladenosine tRNA methylthiotransferase MtaB
MEGKVEYSERKRRNKMLRILSAKKLRVFYEKHLNQEFTVLFEHENKNGIMNGFTENYIKIVYPYDENLVNKSYTVTTKSITEDGFVSVDLTSVLSV